MWVGLRSGWPTLIFVLFTPRTSIKPSIHPIQSTSSSHVRHLPIRFRRRRSFIHGLPAICPSPWLLFLFRVEGATTGATTKGLQQHSGNSIRFAAPAFFSSAKGKKPCSYGPSLQRFRDPLTASREGEKKKRFVVAHSQRCIGPLNEQRNGVATRILFKAPPLRWELGFQV